MSIITLRSITSSLFSYKLESNDYRRRILKGRWRWRLLLLFYKNQAPPNFAYHSAPQKTESVFILVLKRSSVIVESENKSKVNLYFSFKVLFVLEFEANVTRISYWFCFCNHFSVHLDSRHFSPNQRMFCEIVANHHVR
jgi:hypothetical protein